MKIMQLEVESYFKKFSQNEKGERQLLFTVNGRLTSGEVEFIDKNVGHAVTLTVEPDANEVYESAQEKKDRIELEKYNDRMREKGAHQAELDLDRAEKVIDEPDQTAGLNIPGRRTTEFPDYLNEAGDRYLALGDDGDDGAGVYKSLVDEPEGLCPILIKAPEPGTIFEARLELRKLAETNGFKPVAPAGYGAVYSTGDGQHIGVGYSCDTDGDDIGYEPSYLSSDEDSEPVTVSGDVFPTAWEAQTNVDQIAADDGLVFLTYLEFPHAEVEEVSDETPFAYQDEAGNAYRVEEDGDNGWVVTKTDENETNRFESIESSDKWGTQAALDAYAKQAGWFAVPVEAVEDTPATLGLRECPNCDGEGYSDTGVICDDCDGSGIRL
jgi:hypothetical protein